MTPAPLAVIQLGFDATFRIGDLIVRWETIGLAGAVLAALVLAALIAGRTASGAPPEEPRPVTAARPARPAILAPRSIAAVDSHGPQASEPSAPGWVAVEPSGREWTASELDELEALVEEPEESSASESSPRVRSPAPPHLRRDDLLFIALGIGPGAVLGGRLAYGLAHLAYYRSDPGALLDPALGSLSMSGAVLGGLLSGGYVAWVLGAPLRRWLHVAAVPFLVLVGLAKGAMILGGSGQGLPSDVDWATAYLGAGPWGSLGPSIPSHPAQAYEALASAAVLAVILVAWAVRRGREPGPALFWLALFGWSVGRLGAATTWRDPVVLATLGGDQVVTLGIASLALVGLLLGLRRGHAIRVQGVSLDA